MPGCLRRDGVPKGIAEMARRQREELLEVTVVVAVKVFDGFVIAADSAATIPLIPELGPVSPAQVYNNADKVYHLHRDLPIGLATWGGGFIGTGSISALAKDLRRRLMGLDHNSSEWKLDERTYTVEEVAVRVVSFFYDEQFSHTDEGTQPQTGLLVVGYSAGARQAQAWQINLLNAKERPEPESVFDESTYGWRVWGMPMAISRLIEGIGPGLKDFVRDLLPEEQRSTFELMLASMGGPTVIPAMPFADAIDFAKFCADVTVGYSRFSPGSDTVGGPIDIAAISRHEGFKWVQRKHYYPEHLNPRRPHDHDRESGLDDLDYEEVTETQEGRSNVVPGIDE